MSDPKPASDVTPTSVRILTAEEVLQLQICGAKIEKAGLMLENLSLQKRIFEMEQNEILSKLSLPMGTQITQDKEGKYIAIPPKASNVPRSST